MTKGYEVIAQELRGIREELVRIQEAILDTALPRQISQRIDLTPTFTLPPFPAKRFENKPQEDVEEEPPIKLER